MKLLQELSDLEYLTEASSQPVPKLSDLWRHSDEVSDDVNERARVAALKEIERIKQSNKDAAGARKEFKKSFVQKDFKDFGIDGKKFAKEYYADMMKYFKKHPNDAKDYFVDPSIVTKENMWEEMIKKCKADKVPDPEAFVAMEIFFNPAPDKEKVDALLSYWSTIHGLTPAPKKKAIAALVDQMKAALK